MSLMFDQLISIYRSAIAFLFMFIVALGVTAALAEYVLPLMGLIALLIVLRLVWANTSRY